MMQIQLMNIMITFKYCHRLMNSNDNLRIKNGKVPEGFKYTSDNNSEWMTNSVLKNDR